MKVDPNKPFKMVYPIYSHNLMGYLIESYVVQVTDTGRLSFLYQNISSKNKDEFRHGLDETDLQLIDLTDVIQQDTIFKKFSTQNKRETPADFVLRIYNGKKGEELVKAQIDGYISRIKSQIFPLLHDRLVCEMGADGNPVGKEVKVANQPLDVTYSFDRKPERLLMQPIMKLNGQKIKTYKSSVITLSESPGWILANNNLYQLPDGINAAKVTRFFDKIEYQEVLPVNYPTYFNTFIPGILRFNDIQCQGFTVQKEQHSPIAVIGLKEVVLSKSMAIFAPAAIAADGTMTEQEDETRIQFDIKFRYADHTFDIDQVGMDAGPAHIIPLKQGNYSNYLKLVRNKTMETELLQMLRETGLNFVHGKLTITKGQASELIEKIRKLSQHFPIVLDQVNQKGKRYFIGKSLITVNIDEKMDWFEINAIIQFGPFQIPFHKIRKYIVAGKEEFTLPNGEIAIIPAEWFAQYQEIFSHAFGDEEDALGFQLSKQYLTLVQELEAGHYAQVSMSERLKKLRDFTEVESYPLPTEFKGELRPYQKAGYDWMMFLNSYRLGGCLADDMGLGKTVQTLAMLAKQTEDFPGRTSMLVMPTSLVYNWQKEASRFTPQLRILNHTGTQRQRKINLQDYDIILTSYGTLRSDINMFGELYFHYVILDESQAIKNPSSIISKVVMQLRCANKLILTGTPIENSTLDLWSQMNFVNHGLLGSQSFFRKHYLIPIEKKGDPAPLRRLHALIKPFILRRNKSQVATELPDKVENLVYCGMTEEQERRYNEAKNLYRTQILDQIEQQGVAKSRLLMLRGLTHLRQLANHPAMVDASYEGSSGKIDDVFFKIEDVVSENHKILVFSQFVKHLSLIRRRLEEGGIKYAYLDGSTKDRQSVVEEFQRDQDTHVFLISIKAGGVGLNLTAADYVFILDPWWNPAVEAQAVDRAHRIGQQNTVFTYKFITQNTVEEKILALQDKKRKLITDLISTEESFVKSLSAADIAEILG